MNRSPRPGAGVFAAALFICSSAVAQITGSFERTVSVPEPLRLEVATGSGEITVQPGDPGQARIQGTIKATHGLFSDSDPVDAVHRLERQPPIELSGSTLRVGRLEPWAQGGISISYVITVPARTAVSADSGSGNQSVSSLAGPVEARAGSGTIVLRDIGGPARVSTGSGAIRVDGVAGAFTGRAGSGSITVRQTAPGDVEVSTGSGHAELTGIDGGVRVLTGSGGVSLEGRPSKDWDLQAGSGSVDLRLPADAAFDLDARGGGEVYTSHPLTVRGGVERGRLSGQANGGGPLLRVRAGSGSIRIE
jgi:Toastrack DUF4097